MKESKWKVKALQLHLKQLQYYKTTTNVTFPTSKRKWCKMQLQRDKEHQHVVKAKLEISKRVW